MTEGVVSDLYQVTVELTVIPCAVNVVQVVVAKTEPAFHEIVGLGNKLHHAVLDAVVNHLHKMSRFAPPKPGDTGPSLDLGGHCVEDRADPFVGIFRPAGHDAWAMPSAVLTARDADAEKLNPPLRQCLGPQVRVIEVRVTGIDDQITGRQTRQEIVNHRIDGWARRNEYHDGARHAEQTHKLSYILRAADVAGLRLLTQRRSYANVLVIADH